MQELILEEMEEVEEEFYQVLEELNLVIGYLELGEELEAVEPQVLTRIVEDLEVQEIMLAKMLDKELDMELQVEEEVGELPEEQQ
jgi:hypothetical protein